MFSMMAKAYYSKYLENNGIKAEVECKFVEDGLLCVINSGGNEYSFVTFPPLDSDSIESVVNKILSK